MRTSIYTESENYPKYQNQDTWINSHFAPHIDQSACSKISYKALHLWEAQFRRFLVPSHTVSATIIPDFSIHQCLDCSKGLSSQTNPENTFFSPFYWWNWKTLPGLSPHASSLLFSLLDNHRCLTALSCPYLNRSPIERHQELCVPAV